MFKRLTLFIFGIFFFFCASSAQAFKPETFITFTNPIRGPEGWGNTSLNILDLPKLQYAEATHSAYPITWALRFDAVVDATTSAFFENLKETDHTQSIGAFLEITPNLAKAANVTYPAGLSIFDSNRIFLSGYSLPDREILIDEYMKTFFNRFGFYPKSVVAWHLDSYSLSYLQTKYSVLIAMNCDDQYSMDHYRIWGGYLGSPYFPDKNNSMIPAKNANERINLAMVRWAQRDLFNFYGSYGESLYSIQANDYLKINKNINYFENLLSLYGQKTFNEFTYLNIGLENDDSLMADRLETIKILKLLKAKQDTYSLHFMSLADFGDWFKARYPESSPAYYYQTTDPAKVKTGTIYWYQSPFYRIGFKSDQGVTKIIDFRIYNRNVYEDYFATPNQDRNLYHEIPAIIDSVKYPGTEISLDINLEKFVPTHDKQWDMWRQSFVSGSQKIILDPEKITFENIKVPQVHSQDIQVVSKHNATVWEASPQKPTLNKSHLTIFFWLFVLALAIYIVKKIKKSGRPQIPLYLALGIVLAGISTFTVIMNGQIRPFGIGFSGPNGHDAIFHLSLIEKFAQFPQNFNHPQISGEKLSNYHFVFDYLSGLIVKIFGISSLSFYFQVFPVLAGVFLVFLLDTLFTSWKYTAQEKLASYILVFLGGSFGFIPKIITGQDIFSGESAFWSNQSVSLFLNPPFVLSIIFLTIFLNFYSKSLTNKKLSTPSLLVMSLLGGILAQTKVYAFILLLGALLINKKIKLLIGVLIIGVLISLPFSSLTGSPFQFSPFWFPRSLFASYDRFYWPTLVSAWQAYEASGVFVKLIAINLFAATVFLVGNLGMRLIGLIGMFFSKPKDDTESLSRAIILLGIIIPLVFIQKVNPWNTIQFMYYSLFLLGPITAKYILNITSRFSPFRAVRYFFIVIFFVLATITSVGTLKDYFGFYTSSRISFTEIQALNRLREEPFGIVLSPVINASAGKIFAPKPLYSYVSTAYISASSGKSEFLSDTINLDITGFDYKERMREVQRFYNTEDKKWATKFLKDNNITYVYETPLQKIRLNPEDIKLKKVFDSGEISIYTKVL